MHTEIVQGITKGLYQKDKVGLEEKKLIKGTQHKLL